MFYKKNKMALVAILCVVAVCANLFACSKKDSAASSGSDSGTASGGGSSQEQAVAKADKKAEKASAPKGVKFATKPTPEADFVVTLTGDSTGARVTEYKGTDSAVYVPATIQGLPVKEVNFELPYGVTSLVVSDGCEVVEVSSSSGELGSIDYDTLTFSDGTSLDKAKVLKAISLPDSVKSFTLYETFITEFEVPASVQEVGPLPVTLEKVSFRGVPEVIGDNAFSGTKITSIVLPEGVKEINFSAFARCKNLESLTLPSTIESIVNSAFSGCSNLKELVIPESLTSVEFGMLDDFRGCSSLPLATQARLKQLGYTGSF